MHPCDLICHRAIPSTACVLRWALIDMMDDRFPDICRAELVIWSLSTSEKAWEDLRESSARCQEDAQSELRSCWCGKYWREG